MRAPKPKSTDEYLASLDSDKRAALQNLREVIKSVLPQAVEDICYCLPAFRLNGKFLLAYGAAKNHCAFYPGGVTELLEKELKNYDTSKGTVRFPPDKPLPVALVKKLIKLRIAKGKLASK